MSHIKLTDPFPPDWEGKPKHMSPGDMPIWRIFQSKFGKGFKEFHFDVQLGTTPPAHDDTESKFKQMWKKVTSKRIDVVGVKVGEIWIMEFRPVAGMSAVGNAISYTAIWNSDPPDKRRAIPFVITDTADPDILKTAEKIGITIIETDKL